MRHLSKLIACSKIHRATLMREQLLYRERMAAAIQSHCFTRGKTKSFLHGFSDNYVSSSTSDDPGGTRVRLECLKSPVIVSFLDGMNKGRLKKVSRYNSLLARSPTYRVSWVHSVFSFLRNYPICRRWYLILAKKTSITSLSLFRNLL